MAEPLPDQASMAQQRVTDLLRREFPRLTEYALGTLAHQIVQVVRDEEQRR